MMGRVNGAARIVGFVDFGDGVEIGDMKKGDVLEGKMLEEASVLKEGLSEKTWFFQRC